MRAEQRYDNVPIDTRATACLDKAPAKSAVEQGFEAELIL
jgi:hypothetical protein